MRESEFNRLMSGEFGEAYAGMVARSHHLGALNGKTAVEAMAEGVPARRVWEAVCDAFDIPPERHWGEDLPIVNHPID